MEKAGRIAPEDPEAFCNWSVPTLPWSVSFSMKIRVESFTA
jgi:hypothetical protein